MPIAKANPIIHVKINYVLFFLFFLLRMHSNFIIKTITMFSYFKLSIVTGLLILSGIFSGLNLSLFSLNLDDLERKSKLGNKYAKKILPVRKYGNLLLCSLLLGNVAVNAFIAIILNSLVKGLFAGIFSTGLILVFGEILPQAAFSRFAILVGAKTAWLVKVVVFLFFPVAYPLAWLLDKLLGAELSTIWSKKEIAEIIKHHENSNESIIDKDEKKIILGALDFSDKTAETILTPRNVVFALNANTMITHDVLDNIKNMGFTRIPVYEKELDNIIGVLYVKTLIGFKPDQITIICDVCDKKNLIHINKDVHLDRLLNIFLFKKKHIGFVYNDFGSFLGIVTLEDIIEEILTTEIMDETDKIKDMQQLAKEKFNKDVIKE